MNNKVGMIPRQESMPQTIEEWKYLAEQYEFAMLAAKAEISQLKQRINRLEQRVSATQ